jgi:uncharacterized protein
LSNYLDASVLLPTLIAEPTTEAVYDCLGADGRELLISDFAAAEVASALSRLVRRGPRGLARRLDRLSATPPGGGGR